MAAIDQTTATNLLNATLGVSTLTAFSGSAKLALSTTVPTSTSAGTELSGTGYSRASVSFNSASAGATTGPVSSATWTNGSGSPWTIEGLNIYDSAGSPVRYWFGTFVGQPITVANTNVFVVPAGGLAISLT